jgi:alkylated DNA repair protein (DNA oxidative demethylase)
MCSPARGRTRPRCAQSPSGKLGLGDLLDCLDLAEGIGDKAVVLRGYAWDQRAALLMAVEEITAVAPFRNMITPGGFRMSVAMTNCGRAGWVTDRKGYRYDLVDPITGHAWPPMPVSFRGLAARAAQAAGFAGFEPDACLINRYEPGTRLSPHRDENERLDSGDVVVWGGPDRLVYHGVAPLAEGDDPVTGRCRINLTLRKAL